MVSHREPPAANSGLRLSRHGWTGHPVSGCATARATNLHEAQVATDSQHASSAFPERGPVSTWSPPFLHGANEREKNEHPRPEPCVF